MKKSAAVLAVLSLLALGACNTVDPTDRALGGAVLGGGAGALIGGLATGKASGALIGAGVGAASGAVVGAATAPRGYAPPAYGSAPPPSGYGYAPPAGRQAPRCLQEGYDGYGRVYCVRWDYPYDRPYGYDRAPGYYR